MAEIVLNSEKCSSSEEIQKYLDSNQYTKKGLRRYEHIFGKFYISTGGEETTAKFCSSLNMLPNQKVLDVGCGIGGSAFFMARHYGVDVYGADLSSNMIDIAYENRSLQNTSVKHRVQFHLEDATKAESYPENFYDVVYSRDAIIHIEDKLFLFKNFLKCLKPGGQILISDYCLGRNGENSTEFKEYVKSRDYHLLNVDDYGQILKQAGFGEVEATDNSDYFAYILRNELEKYKALKEDVLKELSEKDFNYIVRGWENKIRWVGSECHAWGLFRARKLFN